LGQGLLAKNLVDSLGCAGDRWRGDDGMRSRKQLKVLVRVGEGVVGYERRNVAMLGLFGAEKFAAGRSIEEEIGDG